MLVFDNPRERHVMRRVVHHGTSLMVTLLQSLMFESNGTVFEGPVTIIEIGVDGTGIDDVRGLSGEGFAMKEKIRIKTHFRSFKEGVDEGVLASGGNTLVGIVEIVVVVNEAHRKAFDDKGR